MEETLGKRIVANRKRLGITQDRLAEQLGVTAQAVSKWENDQSCPDIAMLPKLAEIFGISVDALLGIAPQQSETAVEAEVVTSEASSETAPGHGANWEFHWDSGRKGYLGLATWIILTGGWMFAAAYHHIDADFWDLLWTNGLIVFGLFGLFPRFSFLPWLHALWYSFPAEGTGYPPRLSGSGSAASCLPASAGTESPGKSDAQTEGCPFLCNS